MKSLWFLPFCIFSRIFFGFFLGGAHFFGLYIFCLRIYSSSCWSLSGSTTEFVVFQRVGSLNVLHCLVNCGLVTSQKPVFDDYVVDKVQLIKYCVTCPIRFVFQRFVFPLSFPIMFGVIRPQYKCINVGQSLLYRISTSPPPPLRLPHYGGRYCSDSGRVDTVQIAVGSILFR